ncbi:hypothetical protein ACFLT7_07615 [candidate division KSB1 bacterium]
MGGLINTGAENLDELMEEGKRLVEESRATKRKWMDRLGVDREKFIYNHPTAREEMEDINKRMSYLQRRIESLKKTDE